MKRKIQILLLAVAMCLLIPMTSAKADVQGAGTKANPYLVSSYDDLKTYLVKGYVKLMTDISLPENNYSYITIDGENEYGIDLNGYVIDLSNNKATYFICINNSNAIFTLSDSNPTKDHGNKYTSKSGAVIKGGIICNNAGQYNIIYGTCAEINVEGGTFFNNSSMYTSSGGAQTVCITARMASTKTNISNAAFYDNTNNSYYAVLWLQGPANISNCIFDGNSAKYSSVLYVQEETKIEECTFTNNSSDIYGTIYSNSGTNSFCSFKDCQIENNYVTTADDKLNNIAGIYAGYNCKGLKFDGKNIIRNNGYMSGTELIQRNVGLYRKTGLYITLGENFSKESIIALYSEPISQDYSIKYVTDGVPFESCFTVDSDKQSLKKVDNDLYLAGPITYYTVSFNTMGHGVTPNSQQVAKGDKVIDPMIPKTDGRYKFEGWYYSESYSFMWDFNTTVTDSRTLYAKWSAKPVVGMPCNGESEIVIDENGVFKNPAAPTYLDYVFDGWYTLPVGGTKLDTSDYLSCTYYAHWKKSDGTAVLTMPLFLDMDPDLSQYSLGEPGAYALINVNPNNEPESVKLNVDDLAAFGITYDSTEKAFVFDNVHAEAVVSGNELSIFKFCDENTRIILKNDNVIKVIAEPGGDIISGFLSEHDISFEGDGSLEIDLTGTGAPAQNYSVAGIKSGNFTNNANITINANAVNDVCGIVTTDSEFVNNGQVTVNIDGTGYDEVSCTGASSKSIVINSGTFNVTLPGKTENEYMLVWEQDIVLGSGSGYVAELNNAVDKDGNGVGIMESATGRGSLMVSSASGSNTASLAVKKVVTVTPDADQGKIFGDDDATLTFTADDANAQITGALAREAGEDVGEYAFTLGTLQASGNYRLVLDASAPVYRIEKKQITVTPDAGQGKIFGNDDAVFAYTCDDTAAEFTGALAREAGEDAGEYAFTLGTLQASDNYLVMLDAYAPVYRIEKKQITVTPDADQGKIFGDDDATLTFTADDANAQITGALAREAGEDVGEYAFTLGTLQVSDNYLLVLDASAPVYRIEKKQITVTPDAGQGKIFGNDDAVFAYTCDDTAAEFTGALAREAGEDVGEYAFTLGTLQASDNYLVMLDADAPVYIIATKKITVTPDAGQGKVFGDDDTAFTFVCDDTAVEFTGALAREAGEDVGEYAFTLGTLKAKDNYLVVLNPEAPVYRIEKKQITVMPDAGQGKAFGEDDTAFTFTCDDTAAEFTGALAREAGEDAGEYAFTLGTLWASDNYLVMLDAAAPAYTISKKKATLTVKNADKMLKEADPEFTYSVTGMAGSDEITGVRIEREAGEAVGEYAISASFDTSAYPNYEVEIVNGRLQISGHDFSLQIVSPEYLCSAATCTSPATYYYACECGEHGIETFDYGDLRPHAYIYFATKIEATLESDGLATYMCAECGDKVERTVSRLYEAEPEKALVITAVMEGEINTVKMDAVVENGTAKVDDITTYMFERAFEKVVKVPQNEDGTQNGDGNTAEGSDVTTGDNSETGAASSGNKNSENPSNPDNTISLDFSDAEVKVNGVEFTKGTVEALSEFLNDDSNEAEYLSIKLPDKEIILDRKVAETIGKNMSGDSIRLVVDDTSTENLNDMQQEALAEKDVIASVDAYFVCNGKELHDFEGGEAVVSMDVALDSKTDKTHIFVYYIDDEGNFEEMVTWIEDGIIYFKTTHFSDYVIIYDENKTNATKKSVKAPYIKMSKTIGLGNKFALNVTNVSEKARVTYTSSDESVATVDDNGVITAVGKGKCTIVGVIKQKGTAYKFAIDVKVKKTNKGNRQLKEKECLIPDSVTPLLNIYKAVSTKKPFALNIKRLAEDAAVTYTSEDESIATVSEDGVITGLRKGYTGINVNIQQNGKSYQYRIYVRVSTGK